MDDERRALFDRWATVYDRDVGDSEGFPFEGYSRVLNTLVVRSSAEPGLRVLDLGTGTGNVAARFAELDCEVLGVDFSEEMLVGARLKLPQAAFTRLDLLEPWPEGWRGRFHRVVSAYLLHEFDLPTKVTLLRRAAEVLAPGGVIVVGDIAFEDGQARERAYRRWGARWDEGEDYWAAAEALAALEPTGLRGRYQQVSSCAGVFVITPVGSHT